MKSSPNLKVLKLSSCGIDDEGMVSLTKALTQSSRLKELQLQRNIFTHEGAVDLAKVIQGNRSLETISLLGCDAVGKIGTIRLLQSLTTNQTVQKLFLPDAFQHVSNSEHSYLASRVVWLPDIATQNIVKLYGTRVNVRSLGESVALVLHLRLIISWVLCEIKYRIIIINHVLKPMFNLC